MPMARTSTADQVCFLHVGCLPQVPDATLAAGAGVQFWRNVLTDRAVSLLQKSEAAQLPSSRMTPGTNLESARYTDSDVLPLVFGVLYSAYTGFCLWYELRKLRQAEEHQENQKSSAVRDQQWDLIKFVMLYFVIFLHAGREGFLDEPLTKSEQSVFLMLSPFSMPCFTFISGVFGASVASESFKKMLCYTIGCLFLTKLLLTVVMIFTPGPKDFAHFLQEGDWVLWYLKCLAVWRLTLTPLFHIFRQWRISSWVPFVVVFMTSFTLRHWAWPPPEGWLRDTLFFAPFYAQGLVLTAGEWSQLLQNRGLSVISTILLVFWCVGLWHSAWFREWNDVACSLGQKQCPGSHWPKSVSFEAGTLGKDFFVNDLRVYFLMNCLMLAIMWFIVAVARPLRRLAPRLFGVIDGCGARTLYGYVLHEVFILVLGMRMGVHFPPMPSWLWITVSFIAAAQANFVWCSSLTERLFSWIIMPFWIKDLAGRLHAGASHREYVPRLEQSET